jgi:hypothetical protein
MVSMDFTLGRMRYGRVDLSLIVALRVLIVHVPSDAAVSAAQAIQACAQPIPTPGRFPLASIPTGVHSFLRPVPCVHLPRDERQLAIGSREFPVPPWPFASTPVPTWARLRVRYQNLLSSAHGSIGLSSGPAASPGADVAETWQAHTARARSRMQQAARNCRLRC